jgi:hypothetical protein
VWLGGLFPKNIYYSDAILLLYPPFFIFIFAFYLWKHKQKEILKGIIIGGLIYCFCLGFLIAWDTAEMGCGRYFFNLFTTCPGIK